MIDRLSLPLGVSVVSDYNHDEGCGQNGKQGKEPVKLGSVDILAIMIAAFQIIVPYLLAFIIAILLVPALFYLVSYLTGR